MAFRPAGVHAEEHLTPVLGLRAAGSGVERKDCVVGVVLAGEEGGKIRLLQRGLQHAVSLLHLRQKAGVVLLRGHFHQGRQVLPLAMEFCVVFQLVFQLLGPLEHLLGRLEVVPEIRVPGFFLQLLHLPARALQVQSRRQLLQTGADGGQFLFVNVIFYNWHEKIPPMWFAPQFYPLLCHKMGESVKGEFFQSLF